MQHIWIFLMSLIIFWEHIDFLSVVLHYMKPIFLIIIYSFISELIFISFFIFVLIKHLTWWVKRDIDSLGGGRRWWGYFLQCFLRVSIRSWFSFKRCAGGLNKQWLGSWGLFIFWAGRPCCKNSGVVFITIAVWNWRFCAKNAIIEGNFRSFFFLCFQDKWRDIWNVILVRNLILGKELLVWFCIGNFDVLLWKVLAFWRCGICFGRFLR